MKIRFGMMLCLAAMLISCGGETEEVNDDKNNTKAVAGDVAKKFNEAYEKGATWLAGKQDESGAWTMPHPQAGQVPSLGFTGLAVAALAGGPQAETHKAAVEKGAEWIAGQQKTDGSFAEGGQFMKTYGTAIALMALSAVDKKKYEDKIRGAKAFMKEAQKRGGIHEGGMGYGDTDPGKPKPKDYANMATTGFASEGMFAAGVLPEDKEFWELIKKFCRSVQNSTEVNKNAEFIKQLKAKGLSIGDDGGLFYTPIADPEKASKAGTVKLTDKEIIKSYGSMTYDGIKTYIYAGLAKDSPEVSAAMDWVRKNYSVEAHPGFPYDANKRSHMMGIYYYYVSMAKALDAFGEKELKLFDGRKVWWAADMAGQLVKMQQKDGSWKNEHPRWYESVPELVTSYVLISGNSIVKNLP